MTSTLFLSIFTSFILNTASKRVYKLQLKTGTLGIWGGSNTDDQLYVRVCRDNECSSFLNLFYGLPASDHVYTFEITTQTDIGTINKIQVVHMGAEQLCLNWIKVDGEEYDYGDLPYCWHSASATHSDCRTLTVTSSNEWSVSDTMGCEYADLFDDSYHPTPMPTSVTFAPSSKPTLHPTENPTKIPSRSPSINPTYSPTEEPLSPTYQPSIAMTGEPTSIPTRPPSLSLTNELASSEIESGDVMTTVSNDIDVNEDGIDSDKRDHGGIDDYFQLIAILAVPFFLSIVCALCVLVCFCIWKQRKNDEANVLEEGNEIKHDVVVNPSSDKYVNEGLRTESNESNANYDGSDDEILSVINETDIGIVLPTNDNVILNLKSDEFVVESDSDHGALPANFNLTIR